MLKAVSVAATSVFCLLLGVRAVHANNDDVAKKESFEKFKILFDATKYSCGTTSNKDSLSLETGVDMSLTLKKIPGAEGRGDIRYYKEEMAGLTAAFSRSMSDNDLKLNDSQLKCMQKYLDQLYRYWLGKEYAPASPAPIGPARRRDDRKTGPTAAVTSESGSGRRQAQGHDALPEAGPGSPRGIAAGGRPLDPLPIGQFDYDASIRKSVYRRTGIKIGEKLGQSAEAREYYYSTPITSQRFINFEFLLQRQSGVHVVAHADRDHSVVGLTIYTEQEDEAKVGVVKDLYTQMLRDWGDNNALTLVRKDQRNTYNYDVFGETFSRASEIRRNGSFSSTYAYEQKSVYRLFDTYREAAYIFLSR
ncbi:hypothetical protein OPKNFCMD_5354 [Methylobacterium crusticola]|uniref:Uncharacterized protein n=1 Tax=Methylobacterium crusticola TaxID=1697972 RepID=A0ABQ4R4M2_9HYPH|nr:hypothetical protein [Methylobacterium crusticola]GJD52588.1 hypothetical protein OPKNFCMD_5354 [Methylobacterium crusticola]